MRLLKPCPVCTKPLVIFNEFTLTNTKVAEMPETVAGICKKCGYDVYECICPDLVEEKIKLTTYKCGHLFSETLTDTSLESLDFTSTDGTKHGRDYQKEGVKFIIDSNFNCIIGDQMRLGKTPQSLLALKNRLKERTPCLILVRSANLWQWVREFGTWTTELPNGIWPLVNGTKSFIPPGFSCYIVSMDTFSRPAMLERLLTFGFKLVIVDEAHSFKNVQSNRSQALVKFLHDISIEDVVRTLKLNCIHCNHDWTEEIELRINLHTDSKTSKFSHQTICPNCNSQLTLATQKFDPREDKKTRKCGIVMLTGTAIKNRAEEFFIPLNLVAPDKFTSLERFRRTYLEQDSKGRWSRIAPYMMSEFQETIAPYFLRREKEDVYKDLPALNRIFTVIEAPDSKELKEAYNRVLDEIDAELISRTSEPTFWQLKEKFMMLRRITGLMKVMWAVDYLEACLEDSDRQRYSVGIHHKDVLNLLLHKLGKDNCLTLSGSDNAYQKDWIMRMFESSPQRILILNELAGGVGMDFHYCDNVLVLERQWNSADETQFEFRFYNPDRSIKDRPTNVEYLLVKGTTDQWFHDNVETTRKIMGETIGTNWDFEKMEGSSFKELLEQTVAGRL